MYSRAKEIKILNWNSTFRPYKLTPEGWKYKFLTYVEIVDV